MRSSTRTLGAFREAWCRFIPAVLAASAASATATAWAADSPTNHLTISVLRYADTAGNSPYFLFTRVWLVDPAVQQVVTTVVGDEPWEVTSVPFTRLSAHEWFADLGAATLDQLSSLTSGTWSIEVILENSSSTSEFVLDLSLLAESDLPPTPTISSPTAFGTDVPNSVAFAWSNPWPSGAPDRLEIFDHSDNGCGPAIDQARSSVDGTLDVSATRWQPPAPLGPGPNLFRVTTSRVALETQADVSEIRVTSGAIRWGPPPGSPKGLPANTPLLLIGSHRMITFEVEPRREGDLNGDGVVDGDDLGTLLGNWG